MSKIIKTKKKTNSKLLGFEIFFCHISIFFLEELLEFPEIIGKISNPSNKTLQKNTINFGQVWIGEIENKMPKMLKK